MPLLLILSSGVPAGSVLAADPNTLTAQQVIDRIKAHTGGSWKKGTVDTFKAGDPKTPVTGIVTTFADTFVVDCGARLVGIDHGRHTANQIGL